MDREAEEYEPEKDILKALEQACQYMEGDHSVGTETIIQVPSSVDVKKIREINGLSQREFASRYGVPLESIKNWEQGRRVPHGAARTLLMVIARNPEAVERALCNG